ncbi:hypothetical protein B9Z19DRAFT_1096890 [Tuber borchii]|uniref:Uncharacterized protein n=1 Tax=Tuber borchii TaxID=42251 RepID=A0A2T6ZAY3_TUBBO|nr:hypothetical protein B9Z19DRAFT_1096890 [Tuber borchii]
MRTREIEPMKNQNLQLSKFPLKIRAKSRFHIAVCTAKYRESAVSILTLKNYHHHHHQQKIMENANHQSQSRNRAHAFFPVMATKTNCNHRNYATRKIKRTGFSVHGSMILYMLHPLH